MQYADRLKALRERQIDGLLAPLRDKFAADLPAQAEAIDALMLAAEAAADPREPLGRIRAIVHKLSGVASILGQSEVGQLAQHAEGLIADFEQGEGPTLGSIGDALEALVLEMERHAEAARPAAAAGAALRPGVA